MFSIIISEKGGAERKESFEKAEINIGRVAGNDLVLAKGNVSKHHARLLFRDSRLIVTDLKSTNGTYVNGRKIQQATIVREGDKVYLGDFVLRLDSGAAVGDSGDLHVPIAQPSAPSVPDSAPVAPGAPAFPTGGAGAPPRPKVAAPTLTSAMLDEGQAPMPPKRPSLLPRSPGAEAPAPVGGGVSASKEPTARPAPPRAPTAPPALPGAAGPSGVAGGPSGPTLPPSPLPAQPQPPAPQIAMPSMTSANYVPPQHTMPAPPDVEGQEEEAPYERAASDTPPPPHPAASSPVHAAPLRPTAPREAAPAPKVTRPVEASPARTTAAIALMARVGQVVDLSQVGGRLDLQQSQTLEQVVREQAGMMRAAGEVPDGVDGDMLIGDAMAELLALGPLGALLDDEELLEIQCLRHDLVLVRDAHGWRAAPVAFSSDLASSRVVTRLLEHSGGVPAVAEGRVERRLANGAQLSLSVSPAGNLSVFSLRKAQPDLPSLADWVRDERLSAPMAALLEACIERGGNVLVVVPRASVGDAWLTALAEVGTSPARLAVLAGARGLNVRRGFVTPLPADEAGVRAASQLDVERVVAPSAGPALTAALVEAMTAGLSGVLLGVSGAQLRQAFARASSQLQLARPGVSDRAAREALAAVFDVAVELVEDARGEVRVARIVELVSAGTDGVTFRELLVADKPQAAVGVVALAAAQLAERGKPVEFAYAKRGAAPRA